MELYRNKKDKALLYLFGLMDQEKTRKRSPFSSIFSRDELSELSRLISMKTENEIYEMLVFVLSLDKYIDKKSEAIYWFVFKSYRRIKSSNIDNKNEACEYLLSISSKKTKELLKLLN